MLITAISCNISWEDKNKNFERIESVIEQLSYKSDVIILPEMFSTGFTMNVSVAENINGPSVNWMKYISNKYNVAVVGSIPFSENNNFYNRGFFVLPDGNITHYNKRHLFRMSDEHTFYTKGTQFPIVNYKNVNFALNICYDIRFPVWSRNSNLKYDVIIYVANFPKQRIAATEVLIKARAIENESYAVFVNRDGSDNLASYCPSSQIVDFKGNSIGNEAYYSDCLGFKTQVVSANLDLQALKDFRDKFPAWLDEDNFNLNLL